MKLLLTLLSIFITFLSYSQGMTAWTRTSVQMSSPTAVNGKMMVSPHARYNGVYKEFPTTNGEVYIVEFDAERGDFNRLQYRISAGVG